MTVVGDLLTEFREKPATGDEPPVLTLTERNGFVRQADRFNKRLATEDVSNYKVVRRNDIAFNPYLLWAGALAQNTIVDVGIISPLYPTFRVRNSHDPRYVARLLLSPQLVGAYDGIAFGSVPRRRRSSVEDFLKLPVAHIPTLAEQRRIAAILDHADALRAKRRQVLAQLDTLTQSIFNDMFRDRDDPLASLDSLVDEHDRMNYGVVQPGNEVPGGVPLIRVSNLVDGLVDRSDLKRISPEIESAYRRSRIRGTEILVSCVGSIGSVAMVSPADTGSNVARAITRIPISDPVTRNYIAAYLRSDGPQRYFAAEVRTVAQPTLNVKQLAATPVPVPPYDLQASFVKLAEEVNAQRAAAQRAISADDELFASLQTRAFRGEL